MSEIEFSASSLSHATFDALPFISMVDVDALGSNRTWASSIFYISINFNFQKPIFHLFHQEMEKQIIIG